MLDWNDLKLVLAIAEAGTLSGATRLLEVSQPTVSRRLTAFETALGLKLFDRGPEGYSLTPAGKRVHACALQIELEVCSIERNLADDGSSEGHIVLTTSESFGIYCVTPLMAEFHSRFPRISLDMIVSPDAVNVQRRTADIAVRVGGANSNGLVRRHIGKVHYSIFGSTDYLEKNGEPKTLDDLRQHAIIGSSGAAADFRQVKLLLDMSEGGSAKFATDNLINHLAAVKSGLGLMALPTYVAADSPEIRPVLVEKFYPNLDVWILTHKDLAQVERIRCLVDFLADGIGEKLTNSTIPPVTTGGVKPRRSPPGYIVSAQVSSKTPGMPS